MDTANELLLKSKKPLEDFSDELCRSNAHYRESFEKFIELHLDMYKKEARAFFKEMIRQPVGFHDYISFKENYLNMLLYMHDEEAYQYMISFLKLASDEEDHELLRFVREDLICFQCEALRNDLIAFYKENFLYMHDQLTDLMIDCFDADGLSLLLKEMEEMKKQVSDQEALNDLIDDEMKIMCAIPLSYDELKEYAFRHKDHPLVMNSMKQVAKDSHHDEDLIAILEESETLSDQDYDFLLDYYSQHDADKYQHLLKEMVYFKEPFNLLDYRAYKELFDEKSWRSEVRKIIDCRSDLERGDIYYEEEMDDELTDWLSHQNLSVLKSFADRLKDDPDVYLSLMQKAIIAAADWCESETSVADLLDDLSDMKNWEGGMKVRHETVIWLRKLYADHTELMQALEKEDYYGI